MRLFFIDTQHKGHLDVRTAWRFQGALPPANGALPQSFILTGREYTPPRRIAAAVLSEVADIPLP